MSDAGTPLLSDPGARLVRAALDAGYEVVPIPGASALLAALVASGLSADRFTFYGFIPRKGGSRDALLGEIAASPYTSVLYEAPQRVGRLVEDLLAVAGAERNVVLARELTKLHEEHFRGTLAEAAQRLTEREPRGEFVVLLEGHSGTMDANDSAAEARILADALLAQGVAPSAVARELRERLSISRNEAYQLAQEAAERGQRGR